MRALPLVLAALAVLASMPTPTPAQAGNPTWRVFATREGLVGGTTANGHVIASHDRFVALPSSLALTCNGCFAREVRVCHGARCVTAPVWDVGPWNTKDDYWDSPRAAFNDLPRGLPEAQAAFESGYNGGKDQFGRTVLNPAGIDLADGTFWDDLGMTGNDWVDVTFLWVDVPALSVSVLSPRDLAWQRGTITAQGATNEDGSLSWARFLVDGSVAKWATAAPHTWTFDTHGYKDGAHTLAFEAKDTLGATASASVRMRVDNTPPSVAIDEPRAGAVTVADRLREPDPAGLTVLIGDVAVQAAASDATSGVARVEFRVDGQLRASDASPPYAWTWPTGEESAGAHTLTVTAWDAAGNARSATLRADVTVPTSVQGVQRSLPAVP